MLTEEGHKLDCEQRSQLSEIVAPYTFPLLIEFCVGSSTLLLAVWQNCELPQRSGEEGGSGFAEQNGDTPEDKARQSVIDMSKHEQTVFRHHDHGPAIMLTNDHNKKVSYIVTDRTLFLYIIDILGKQF